MDSQALLATKDPETNSKYFVTIRGEKSLDTNVQELSKRVNKYTGETKSETVTANYLALLVNRRLLLVKAGDNKKATEFTGSLVVIPEDARTKIISDIESQNPRLRNVFLPVMLEVSDFRVWGYWLFGLGVPLTALGIYNLFKVAHRTKNPDKHPIIQSLTRFGATEAIAAQIDSEVQMEANNSTIGSIVVTPSWLLRSSTFGLNIVNLNEVVWVYKKVTTHYKYFIPIRKAYDIVICDRRGETLHIASYELGGLLRIFSQEKNINRSLEEIIRRIPWVFAGFDENLMKLWTSDRSQIIEAVDERQRQFMNQK